MMFLFPPSFETPRENTIGCEPHARSTPTAMQTSTITTCNLGLSQAELLQQTGPLKFFVSLTFWTSFIPPPRPSPSPLHPPSPSSDSPLPPPPHPLLPTHAPIPRSLLHHHPLSSSLLLLPSTTSNGNTPQQTRTASANQGGRATRGPCINSGTPGCFEICLLQRQTTFQKPAVHRKRD